MGVSTSLAGVMFSVPDDPRYGNKVRFGVSALALDHKTESRICWGEWHDVDAVYDISDEILISDNVIKPGEGFLVQYADPAHEKADWILTDFAGKVVAESFDMSGLGVYEGLAVPGIYDLTVRGFEKGESGRVGTTRVLKGFVQVTGEQAGDRPHILSVDVPGSERLEIDGADYLTEYHVDTATPTIEYTIDSGSTRMSRGVRVGESGLGFRFKDTGLDPMKSFSVSFWFKPESFNDKSVHALNIRHKGDPWAINNWGWMWHTLTEDGRSDAFTIRMASGKDASYRFDGMKLHPGAWYHLAYSFEFDEKGCVKPSLFVNGERQEITAWSLGDKAQDGEVVFAGPAGAWKQDNVVALGGYLHKSGSVRGNTDNLMVWNKALVEDDVKLAMSDIKVGALPAEIIGFFDFESDPDGDCLFGNKVSDSFKAGIHGYKDTEVEGQGSLVWRVPEFCTGCPFTSGDSFILATDISWDAPGATVLDRADDGEEGSVRLSYQDSPQPKEGHRVTLTAENEYGLSDSRFMIIFSGLDDVSTVETESGLNVSPGIFDSEIYIQISDGGLVRLSLYSMDGRCVLSNSFNALSGDTLKIYPDVPAGAYILRAEKDGMLLGTARLIRH